MFYIAVVKGSEIKYAEHYEERVGFDRRAVGLKTQAMIEGEGWSIYRSEEPYESFLIRQNTAPTEDETPSADDTKEQSQAKFDAYKARVDALAIQAAKTTTSKLTPTMPDDSKLDN